MSRAVSLKALINACKFSITEAEDRYSKWSGGITMRAAPESLVQTILAEQLFKAGGLIALEASVQMLVKQSLGETPIKLPRNDHGRFDIVVYYASRKPRLLLEVKKSTGLNSLQQDHQRIVEVLKLCPKIQSGIIVAYGTAVNAETVRGRIYAGCSLPNTKLVGEVQPFQVKGKFGGARVLGAGIYQIDPP